MGNRREIMRTGRNGSFLCIIYETVRVPRGIFVQFL